jgi:hypothetical protein
LAQGVLSTFWFAAEYRIPDGGSQIVKTTLFTFLLLIVFALAPSSLFAQAAEINPYGGFYWPGDNNGVGEFKNNQLIGVRGGYFITKDFELGGNYAWTNHFQPKSSNQAAAFAGDLGFPQGRVRAIYGKPSLRTTSESARCSVRP